MSQEIICIQISRVKMSKWKLEYSVLFFLIVNKYHDSHCFGYNTEVDMCILYLHMINTINNCNTNLSGIGHFICFMVSVCLISSVVFN